MNNLWQGTYHGHYGPTLVGIGVLALALVAGYFLVRRVALKSGHPVTASTAAPQPEDVPR